jgi:hypothetical protein
MPDEYEKALTHVAYEYAALESAFNLSQTATKTPPLIAAFDSFLIHYRSLVEFFFHTSEKQRRRKDDLRAEDYVEGWTTPTLKEWEKWKDRMHILLAHLSVKRNEATGFDHRTDFKPMLDEIRAAWEKFAAGLSGTPHCGKLDALLTQRREDFTRIS